MHHFPLSSLDDSSLTLPILKSHLQAFSQHQKLRFLHQAPITALIQERVTYFDNLLQRLWHHYQLDTISGLALIAVGGYGRAELHPLSDLDILLLSETPLSPKQEAPISRFITALWDLHLFVGHSVRTLSSCFQIAQQDVTIATNLLEARFCKVS